MFPFTELKYLIVGQSAPPLSQKKSGSGIVTFIDFLLAILNMTFHLFFSIKRPNALEVSYEYVD
jgi:hypothetical protein